MPWIQLSLEAGDLDLEQLSDLLLEAGAVSVTFQDAADEPVLEPAPGATPLWSRTRVVALFEAGAEPAQLIAGLRAPLGEAAERIESATLEDRDWVRAWMDEFRPMRFGERVWICPSHQPPPDPDAVNILLDPGLAFGTGTHPTTALCLEWLDRHPPADLEVIDYGCGSGVLAIAALKLGARHVWAVDNDPQALIATRDNAGRNGVGEGVDTCLPEDVPALQADLMLANILANPLVELAPTLAGQVRPGGMIVLSGILAEQSDMVRAAYAAAFEHLVVDQQDGWVRISGRRRDQYA
ncbi:ribosomal protein L11 methyltransferase [Thiohalobacter sp. COW1]|uniref:Ribosomal protein L11 methyltransferase n=1 Tax=Thiohalobacter thiocyanaticus TaxID=585455 RepID=A0A1Z4VPP5_9GAMM|nr:MULTISPECIES: 50S ribosomal protein L11 methyltransferase [Thiohalobacter]BAZ93204.1 ribosomal protein L11 methyltransferase [Thiohalobacter thiocyanaticus]BCO31767.1 ribosomal protein L11 methyltransferase [Thiohalobacter sp. COW1]